MSDPAIRPRSTVVVPGTPEGDAMVLQHEMSGEASRLRAGRGSLERGDALLARAGRLRMNLPSSFQPEMAAAITELSTARAERVRAEPASSAVEPPPAGPSAADRFDRHMVGALRRLPNDERGVAQHLSRSLLGHARGSASVRMLGRMSGNDLERLMDRADVPEGRRAAVRSAAVGILGQALHREVVGTAERAFDRGVAALSRVARGGSELDRWVAELDGPNAYRVLSGLRLAGAEDEERALRQTVERTHVDPSLRHELAPEVRRQALAAVRSAASSLREYRDDTFGDGHFASDPSGFAYTSFPKAVPLAAQRLGMSADHAAAIGDPPWGETLLERAAAEQLHSAEQSQMNGRRMAVATAVVTSVLTGGTIGLPAAGVVAAFVAEAPEIAAVESHLEQMERAAAVDLASRDDARAARVERNIAASAVAVTIGAEGGLAIDAGAHLHAGASAAAEAVVTHSSGLVNAGRHELSDH